MTAAQILHLNFGRRQLTPDEGEMVSDLWAARKRHIQGEPQPTREPPPEPAPEPEADWTDADVEPCPLQPTLEVDFG